MVDFGNSVFEGGLAAATPLLNPVEDRSGETFAGALSSGMESFNRMVFDPSKKAGQADAAKGSAFAEYAEKVSLISDAKDQKGWGSDEAMRHIRVADNQFLSNYPELADDFITFRNKLMTENGFGGNIVRETPAEAGMRKRLEDASTKGYDINNPESLAAYDNILAAGRDLAAINAEIERLNSRGELVNAQVKERAVYKMHSIIAESPQWINDRAKHMFAQLEGITDPSQRQMIIDQFQAEYDQQSVGIRQLQSQGKNSVDVSYMLTGTDQLVKNYISVANGTNDLASVENYNKVLEAKSKALILTTNPKLATLAALDGMTKFQLPDMIKIMDAEQMKTWTMLNDPTTVGEDGVITSEMKSPDLIDTVDNVAPIFEELKTSTKELIKAGGEPEATSSQANKIVNILRSTNKYGANEGDARNFTAVVDFLSDPTIGGFIESNKKLFPSTLTQEAAYVIEQQYDSVVLPLISERWATAGTQISAMLPELSGADLAGATSMIGLNADGTQISNVEIADVISPVWNGVGVEFKVNDAWKNYAGIRKIAKDLNQGSDSLAGPINKLVRMRAHLTGSTDYEKVYNEIYEPGLWLTGEKKSSSMEQMTGKDLSSGATKPAMNPIDTDNPSELKLSDFSDEEIKRVLSESKAKNPEGMATAGTPLEVAKAYLGKTEANGEDVKTLSAFIGRATGININPATTAWCAAFVDAVLSSSGSKGTGKLNARSYLSWGVEVDDPKVGDVVVLQRGSGGKNDWKGHVGFYMGTNDDGTIKVLGGNQSDSVSEDNYDANKVLGFRRAG